MEESVVAWTFFFQVKIIFFFLTSEKKIEKLSTSAGSEPGAFGFIDECLNHSSIPPTTLDLVTLF